MVLQEDGLQVSFDEPVWAVTPGQYAVFYDGDQCLGSAEILAAGRPDIRVPVSA